MELYELSRLSAEGGDYTASHGHRGLAERRTFGLAECGRLIRLRLKEAENLAEEEEARPAAGPSFRYSSITVMLSLWLTKSRPLFNADEGGRMGQ